MAAIHYNRIDDKGTYSHIYNKGISNEVIFKDFNDYEVFIGFLKEYLTPRNTTESVKKVFTVNGKDYKGVPHLPQNYFNKVELIAYRLLPNHFHLILHQLEHGSIQKFARSLCTRYSKYINNKYKRTGSLFEGPYKSMQIKGITQLLYLTCFLHRNSINPTPDLENGFSSYCEYIGIRNSSWIKPDLIWSFFSNNSQNYSKAKSDYGIYAEKYVFNPSQKNVIESLLLDKLSDHDIPIRSKKISNDIILKQLPAQKTFYYKFTQIAVSLSIFAFLFTLGIRNINSTSAKTPIITPPILQPAVSGVSSDIEISITPTPLLTYTIKPRIIIKINDNSKSVNIRQNPSLSSDIIGEAFEGEIFSYELKQAGWYKVVFASESGYISSKYAQIQNEEF